MIHSRTCSVASMPSFEEVHGRSAPSAENFLFKLGHHVHTNNQQITVKEVIERGDKLFLSQYKPVYFKKRQKGTRGTSTSRTDFTMGSSVASTARTDSTLSTVRVVPETGRHPLGTSQISAIGDGELTARNAAAAAAATAAAAAAAAAATRPRTAQNAKRQQQPHKLPSHKKTSRRGISHASLSSTRTSHRPCTAASRRPRSSSPAKSQSVRLPVSPIRTSRRPSSAAVGARLSSRRAQLESQTSRTSESFSTGRSSIATDRTNITVKLEELQGQRKKLETWLQDIDARLSGSVETSRVAKRVDNTSNIVATFPHTYRDTSWPLAPGELRHRNAVSNLQSEPEGRQNGVARPSSRSEQSSSARDRAAAQFFSRLAFSQAKRFGAVDRNHPSFKSNQCQATIVAKRAAAHKVELAQFAKVAGRPELTSRDTPPPNRSYVKTLLS